MGEEIENLKRQLTELKADVKRLGEEVHRLKIGVQPPRDSEAARHQKARRQIEKTS
jgi:regulator of replication initiation timing